MALTGMKIADLDVPLPRGPEKKALDMKKKTEQVAHVTTMTVVAPLSRGQAQMPRHDDETNSLRAKRICECSEKRKQEMATGLDPKPGKAQAGR
eukprot:gene1107-3945_t